MKVFKRRNSLAGLSIFAFLLMLLVIGSFAGCEAASMIPVKNRQATPEPDDRIVSEQPTAKETDPPVVTTQDEIPELPLFFNPTPVRDRSFRRFARISD